MHTQILKRESPWSQQVYFEVKINVWFLKYGQGFTLVHKIWNCFLIKKKKSVNISN